MFIPTLIGWTDKEVYFYKLSCHNAALVAKLQGKLALNEAAGNYYVRYIRLFPGSLQVEGAQIRLDMLRGNAGRVSAFSGIATEIEEII